MDDQALRTCICETGRELLENGLVARTWGNVSARADGGHYLVTPSGMDYGSIAPEDIAACTELYNYYIENTCITLEEEPVTPEEFGARAARITKDYPYIVARDGAGKPIGFAYLDVFNPRSAYRCTADLSIYVDRACRGSGVGQKLYAEIERLGRERGIENLISIITSDNEGSLRFHRKNGFTEIGVMPAVAFKFGKYLDVSFFQKHLG